jgi:hypothetical protein
VNDFPDRAAYERKLAQLLGDAMSTTPQKILDALGDPPDPKNLTQDFWDEIGLQYQVVLEPQLQQVFKEGAAALGNDIANRYDVSVRSAVNWGMIDQRAADWAKKYSYELVKDINDTSRDRLQTLVSDFFEKGQAIEDLNNALVEEYGAYRAGLISITEVTRASVEGEKDIVDEIEKDSSLEMVPTFNTENDDIVCDDCGPLNQQEVEDDDFPPLHPGCRCWLNWEPKGW